MALGESPQKIPRYYKIAAGFLFFVIVLTWLLLAYKFMVEVKNDRYREELANIKMDIAERRKDKDVQAYELYEVNKNKLDALTYLSNVPLFYNTIKTMGREYQVWFNDFSYTKGSVSVSTIAQSNSAREAYEKLRVLIWDYREEEGKWKESIYDLEFVKSFFWSTSISSNFNFLVKPEVKEVEEIVEETEEDPIEE